MSPNKPKTLSLNKTLSLAQQARLLTTFGKKSVEETILQPSTEAPSLKAHNKTSSQSSSEEDKFIIQKQRQERQQRALEWSLHTFPACFNLDHPQPLKIGFLRDLMQCLQSRDQTEIPTRLSLRKTLSFYTQRRQYHQSLLQATHRCDLEGNSVQEITDTERQYAQAQLEIHEKRYQKWCKAKKKKQKKTSASS